MKILILSCNTGGGHNTAARAIKEVFDLQGDECEVKDALSFGGQFASDLVCDSYIEMVKKTPKLFGEIYKMGSKIGQINNVNEKLRSPVYLVNKVYADALEEYIIENKFEAVICVHIFPTEAMTHLKRRHNLKVPFYFVSTDYYCSPMLEETTPDKIFGPHKDSLFTFRQHGIPEDLVVPTGIPVSQKLVEHLDKADARIQLGLAVDDEAYLLMSGSMGFGDTIDIAKYIFEHGNEHTRVVAITGNNEEMYREFEKEFEGETRLRLLGFTKDVPLYMSACDLLLTKPGGLSSTEALVRGIPIIHTSPIPGCESENVQFFTEHHISLCANTAEDAGRLAVTLMHDNFLRNQIIEAQKQYRCENSAKQIVDYVKNAKNVV